MQLEGFGQLKTPMNPIGVQTRDLPACSLVPQPTTPLRAPSWFLDNQMYFCPKDIILR
jgi:hypothetical protein